MQSFTLEYKLDQHGWAAARLIDKDACVEMAVSYLHDSLDDLATAAIKVRRGEADASVLFMDEPGEHKLNLAKTDEFEYRYQVQWFDDWDSCGHKTKSRPTLVMEGVVSAARLVQQIHTVLYRILREHGLDGYKSRWAMHDFPFAKFELLDS